LPQPISASVHRTGTMVLMSDFRIHQRMFASTATLLLRNDADRTQQTGRTQRRIGRRP
jgi:hypothetical protein